MTKVSDLYFIKLYGFKKQKSMKINGRITTL